MLGAVQASLLGIAQETGSATVFLDTFTDTDNQLLSNHLPDTNAYGTYWYTVPNGFYILNNQLRYNGASGLGALPKPFYFINDTNRYNVELDIISQVSYGGDGFMMWDSPSTYWWFRLWNNNIELVRTGLRVQQIAVGSSIGNIKAVWGVNNSVTCYFNNVSKFTHTCPLGSSNFYALYFYDASSIQDNIKFTLV